MAFTVANDMPISSPMAQRTRNRRALSSIQAPNVLQAPASPFSPAKPGKAAPVPSLKSTAPSAGLTVEPALHMPEQMDKKGSHRMLSVALLAAVGAAAFAGAHIHSSMSPKTLGRSSYASVSEWRADAAEEWRLSSESKLLDLTFEEASAMSAVTTVASLNGEAFGSEEEGGMQKWREQAALEWREAPESRSLHSNSESAALIKWGSMGGIGAWREFAANRWRSSQSAQELDLTHEEAHEFSLKHEPFSVSFFPEQTGQKQFLFRSSRAPFSPGSA